MTESPSTPAAPVTAATWTRSLRNPRFIAMLGFGAAAGLPYALLIGTLNAWLGAVGVKVSTIGILSWIGLAYAFKFLWAPVLARVPGPLTFWLGQRRGWIVPCQLIIAACLFVISTTRPPEGLAVLAIAAVIAAFASATQDIAIDAWRVEVAGGDTGIDLLSTAYQFGFRLSALIGGAGALILAERQGWPFTFAGMAAIMGVAFIGALLSPEPAIPAAADRRAPGEILAQAAAAPRLWRNGAVLLVILSWGWAISAIAGFMVKALAPAADAAPVSASKFLAGTGPLIVLATIIMPALCAAFLGTFGGRLPQKGPAPVTTGPLQRISDHIYYSLLTPLEEMIGRLGLACLIILVLVLTYRITDSIWGPFAYPFYLGELKYSNDEVAFASKMFGVIMIIAGVGLGGISLARLGRMPSLVLGAILAAATNLLYIDLARGGAGLDTFLHLLRLDLLAHALHVRPALARLMLVIGGENLAVGYASAAYLAYLSAIVNVRFAAVQFALLTSLTLLVGALGRAPLGELIEKEGYAKGFWITFLLGGIAIVVSLAEWARQARDARRIKRKGQEN